MSCSLQVAISLHSTPPLTVHSGWLKAPSPIPCSPLGWSWSRLLGPESEQRATESQEVHVWLTGRSTEGPVLVKISSIAVIHLNLAAFQL